MLGLPNSSKMGVLFPLLCMRFEVSRRPVGGPGAFCKAPGPCLHRPWGAAAPGPESPFGGILPALPMRRPNNRPPRAHTAMCNLFDPCEHPPAGISLHDFSVKRSRGARTLTWRSQKGLSPSRAGAPTSPDAGSHLRYARSTVRAHLRRIAPRPGGGIQVLHGP